MESIQLRKTIINDLNRTGGVYYCYPEEKISPQTRPPEGFTPFYISHLGRHGSRHLIDNREYSDLINLLTIAGDKKYLTSLGEKLLTRLKNIWPLVEDRDGDLSVKGIEQQRNIAGRVLHLYPEVFQNNPIISARSTTVVRCVLSMDAFCERLKESLPQLNINRNSSNKYQKYLNFHTKEAIEFREENSSWKEGLRKYKQLKITPNRLINSLCNNDEFIFYHIHPKNFMLKLYNIAISIQNIDCNENFLDLFESDELFNIWECNNSELYITYANAKKNKGIMMNNAKPLLMNIINSAEKMIKNHKSGADFRFAHDGNIIPLAMLMHIEDCFNSEVDYKKYWQAWQDFHVAPMSGNIQLIFYKNADNTVLVKILLHENEISIPFVNFHKKPYYLWEELKSFYITLIDDFDPNMHI